MSLPVINLHQAKFTISAPDIRRLPEDSGIEVAFAGRSNAGKSSALNTLTNQKSLARTSKTPGRTQLINVFEIAENKRLIDLPGYGFAKVPLEIPKDFICSKSSRGKSISFTVGHKAALLVPVDTCNGTSIW